MGNLHKYKDEKWTRTKAAILWSGMRARCVAGGAQQRRNAAYIGSTLSVEFLSFEGFYDWYRAQPAFNMDGYELDKDLAGKGGKHYSRETCHMIPKALNLFLSSRKKSITGLPTGVHLTPKGQYQARLRIDSKPRSCGTYSTMGEAERAYINAKNAEAQRWADRMAAGEFLVTPSVIELVRKIDWSAK